MTEKDRKKDNKKNKGRVFGYIRASNRSQDKSTSVSAQEAFLSSLGYDYTDTVIEFVSAGANAPPRLQTLIDLLQKGDRLVTFRLDRLSRSTAALLKIMALIKQKGGLLETSDLSTLVGDAVPLGARNDVGFAVLSDFAELEIRRRLERQKRGIERAKIEGRYKAVGRPSVLTKTKIAEMRKLLTEGCSVAETARKVGVSRSTLYKHFSFVKTVNTKTKTK